MLEYGGFWLEEEKWNNIFAYQERKIGQKLRVAPLKKAGIEHLALGSNPVFAELDTDWNVQTYTWLQNFLFFEWDGVPLYIFDNHNHALAFRYRELFKWSFEKGAYLLHIDQHSDMNENPYFLEEETWEAVVDFTNFSCNVGNFLQPALKSELFTSIEQIRTECKLLSFQKPDRNYLLDIDLDFWAEEMGIMQFHETIKKTKKLISSAKMVTIATSPHFLDQQKALELLDQLLR